MSSRDPCLTLLPPSQVIGLSFTGLAGFISCISIIFVLLLVARNYIRNLRHPPPGGEWKLIRTHVDAYLLSLLASDFLQGLGAIFDVWWAAQKKVYCSATCTTQGIIQQIGETGVAMATLAIAIHTFLVIFFRWSPGHRASWIWKIGISFIWLYVVLFALIAYGEHHSPSNDNTKIDDFFTPTPYWCWISGHFNPERIAGEYFWLWLAAFTSIALYSLLYLRVRGNVTVDPQNWWRVRFKWRRWTAGDEGNGDAYYGGSGGNARGGEAGKTAAREALSMIWYPVTYTILVLPLSIVRWSTFRPSGHAEPNVPFALTAIVVTIFSLSGIANVILMLMTRKNLLLFGQRGVVNPAKIGPAATGRLAHRAGDNKGGRGGAAGDRGGNQARRIPDDDDDNVALEKRGRFNFRPTHNKHNERESSTTDNSVERHHGDTSFAAGRFTTKAYETERSFDVGSDGLPFTPSPRSPRSPISPHTRSHPAFGEAVGGTDTYGYGSGIEHNLSRGDIELGTETGIPEGMSRDLGSAGEYDLERDNREWRSFGSVRSPLSANPVSAISGTGGGGAGPGGLLRADHDTPGEHQSSNRSNFLELSKDSKSVPGSSQEYIASSYPPPPLQEERRGSAASKAGSSSSYRAGGGAADYSVPMKFNPTPAPTTLSPFADPPTTIHSSYQSRNASSKSLPKTSTPTSASSLSPTTYPRLTMSKSSGDIANKGKDRDSTKSPWAPITVLFSSSTKRHQESHESPFNEERRPSVARSDTILIQQHHSLPEQQQRDQEVVGIRPLHFSRDFGPSLRSSLSLVGSEKERALGRSVEEIEPIPISIPPRDSLARIQTRTTATSVHETGSNSGSWSRAAGASRRALHEEDGYNYRPDTSGSGRSYTSYTFGPPGFSTAAPPGASGSVRGGGRPSVEMQERMRYDPFNRYSSYPPEDEIGRAV